MYMRWKRLFISNNKLFPPNLQSWKTPFYPVTFTKASLALPAATAKTSARNAPHIQPMQIDLFNCSHHTWSIFALKNCTTFSQTGFCQILSLGSVWSKFCNWRRDSGGRDQHGSPAKWTLNCRHKLRYETGRKDPLWILKCFFGYVFWSLTLHSAWSDLIGKREVGDC